MSENKQKWDSNLSFLFAMIGSAVGLGNIWRYPYVAYTNGGGSFLIPYIVSIICMGIPLLFVEYGAGFKFKAGMSKIVREINKKYEYLGWFILTPTFFILTYYCCVVAWDLIYLPLSFTKGWGASPDNFFTNIVLDAGNPGGLFHIAILVLCAVVIVWFILWFISHRNLNEGVGKFNKIFIPLLFVMMIIIVLSAITLPGASIGIAKLLTPNLSAIFDLNIWLAAFGQILFSLSVGMSIALAYASYLDDKTDLPKNALTVAIANSLFEIFTAIGVFAILGYMSTTHNIPIDQLVSQGTGLAFVVFPQIFNVMGTLGYIIGPLFFFCLLFAGLTSNISVIEPLALAISDKFALSRSKAVTIVCGAGFIISLIYTTSMGGDLLGIVDTFANNFGVVFNVILEIIIFAWIYGLENIIPSINKNAKFLKLGHKWTILVKYVILVIVLCIWISGIVTTLLSGETLTVTVELILFIALIGIPAVLTKLPARNDDY
ncbi:sodium-dependent transporter [Methanosphaera sp. WGK6]|uniref:sodium-dependent transporter n=1 Tax=Methanosphaera sp. WGK6 TaxID=1561964 RepID=UPI00084CDA4C|nr:sodium-dependent transporter [Methanosphaera sp. WGK6]OED29887.1 sodium:calcium symporter [Methanosphaera sp. WGK6]